MLLIGLFLILLRLHSQNVNDMADFKDNEEDDEDEGFADDGDTMYRKQRTGTHSSSSDTPILNKYGSDITKAAEEDKLDPVVGREKEIERIAQILGRRKKNNPILIGEPGVGKSAIVEGLAIRIKNKKV